MRSQAGDLLSLQLGVDPTTKPTNYKVCYVQTQEVNRGTEMSRNLKCDAYDDTAQSIMCQRRSIDRYQYLGRCGEVIVLVKALKEVWTLNVEPLKAEAVRVT